MGAPADPSSVVRNVFTALSGRAKSRDAIRTYVADAELADELADFEAAFPSFTVRVHDVFGAGNRAVARLTIRGVHRGEFMGVPPSGRTVELPVLGIYEVDGERISRAWTQGDTLSLFWQIGGLPASSSSS
ncbi:MAG TPA: ester cyclase [Gemmatimonadota bacterium]|nr:ester cyclase [Gemmatimonadota bacterium]